MITLFPSGDSAMLVKAGNDLSPETNYRVRQLLHAIQNTSAEGITEIVPAYNELMVYYDPTALSYKDVSQLIHDAEKKLAEVIIPKGRLIKIPVCYDLEYGPDLPYVASTAKTKGDIVVQIHTAKDYLVYMLGFAPGFPYLGGMDKRIACARKEKPRIHVPAGSVGIAGEQTGIYSLSSPGGWQIIGWTPVPLFSPLLEDPFLLKQGDRIRFVAVSKDEILALKKDIESGNYQHQAEKYNS
jgi:inhibitor of KinA